MQVGDTVKNVTAEAYYISRKRNARSLGLPVGTTGVITGITIDHSGNKRYNVRFNHKDRVVRLKEFYSYNLEVVSNG
jgi:hypothetical protein